MTYHNPLPDDLKRDWGIVTIAQDFLPDEFRKDYTKSERVMMAFDAQPTLVSQPNAAIPFMATTYVDPETIRILQTPNKGAEIIGEKKLGDWNTTTVMFERVENTGRAVAYGDYNDDGNTNVNIDFPQRQAFKFQTIVEYGDDAAERASLAKLNFIAEMKNSAVIVMEKFRDLSYHVGIAGLQLYGLLNDPGLSAAITPSTKQAGGTKWVNNGIVVASPNEIMVDFQALIATAITQAPGYIDNNEAFTFVGPPIVALAMTATNSFGLTAMEMIKKTFPNIKIITDPRYATTAGNLVQLWADKFDGHDVGYCGFGEKLREFPVVRGLSAAKQKVAGTTLGAIVRYGLGVAQMLGV